MYGIAIAFGLSEYIIHFLTGPPQFQYQKENCQAANHGLS